MICCWQLKRTKYKCFGIVRLKGESNFEVCLLDVMQSLLWLNQKVIRASNHFFKRVFMRAFFS